MNPDTPETSSQTHAHSGRRRFISCAALALGAASLARAQSASPTPATSPEIEKAVKETQSKETKARARQLARYLKPLVAKYGPGVIDELKANTIEGAKSRFEKMTIAQRDLGAVKELLWDKLDPEKYKIEKLEDTPESLKYRVLTCPWAEAYREVKGAEIGSALSCAWDYGFCQGLNPAIKFTRTKTLMQGDDCCNHCYELKKG
jgi:L-2-amino-thiazoline-4-carboxylic acid hydrolase